MLTSLKCCLLFSDSLDVLQQLQEQPQKTAIGRRNTEAAPEVAPAGLERDSGEHGGFFVLLVHVDRVLPDGGGHCGGRRGHRGGRAYGGG